MLWLTFVFLFCRFFWTDFQLFSPGFLENNPLHQGCLDWVHFRGLTPIYGGLFCGSSDVGGETKTLFLHTGLYHLLVVSGSHLVFLEKLVDRLLKGREKLKLAVFILFAVICQLNPPILRALLAQFLRLFSERRHLFLNDETRILLSGLWCLLLFPQWITSTSLILSWMASLALNYRMPTWKKHAVIAVYLLPWTQTLSLAAIGNNLVFGFVFEWLLFPLSSLCFVVPGLTWAGNALWHFTVLAMIHLPATASTMNASAPLNYWPYVFVFHLFHRIKR